MKLSADRVDLKRNQNIVAMCDLVPRISSSPLERCCGREEEKPGNEVALFESSFFLLLDDLSLPHRFQQFSKFPTN